jgi:hypothetical protein
MARRARRRVMVVLIYATLALLMAGLFMADHWRTSGNYLIIAVILANRFFLGGYDARGLIKPFNGKTPRSVEQPPPFLLLALRVYDPRPADKSYRNDEREIQQLGRAHYLAYQTIIVLFLPLWLLSKWSTFTPNMLANIHVSPGLLTCGLALISIVLAFTLPQSILLWTEPDMEEDSE